MLKVIKNFILNLLFPKFCFNCQKEGNYLCQDCKSTLEISGFHQKKKTKNLSDLYYPCDYQKPLIKRLIQGFKYQPFIKELAKPLTSLIISHFQCLENSPKFILEHFQLIEKRSDFTNFILIPVPLEKRKIKWRGFNQAEEIGKELSKFLNIEVLNNILIKTKETLPQVELSEEERRENIKGVFLVKNENLIKNKRILLVDDVYTTGATMEECASTLRKVGAKEVIGIVVARAKPKEDFLTK